jgi:hypothetical protein
MLHDLKLVSSAERRWRVHFILNSKGGVGKSFIGNVIVQRELARGRPIRCFDGDATTATLSSFPALGAIRLPMMLEGSIIDPRAGSMTLSSRRWGRIAMCCSTAARPPMRC